MIKLTTLPEPKHIPEICVPSDFNFGEVFLHFVCTPDNADSLRLCTFQFMNVIKIRGITFPNWYSWDKTST